MRTRIEGEPTGEKNTDRYLPFLKQEQEKRFRRFVVRLFHIWKSNGRFVADAVVQIVNGSDRNPYRVFTLRDKLVEKLVPLSTENVFYVEWIGNGTRVRLVDGVWLKAQKLGWKRLLHRADTERVFIEVCEECGTGYGTFSESPVKLCGSSSCYSSRFRKRKMESEQPTEPDLPADLDAFVEEGDSTGN